MNGNGFGNCLRDLHIVVVILSFGILSQAAGVNCDTVANQSFGSVISKIDEIVKRKNSVVELTRRGSRIGQFFPRSMSIQSNAHGEISLVFGLTGAPPAKLIDFEPIQDVAKINLQDGVGAYFKSVSSGRKIVAGSEKIEAGRRDTLLAGVALRENGSPLYILLQIVPVKSDGTIDFSKKPTDSAYYIID